MRSADAADPATLVPFLEWHCSASNWPKYDGRIRLAALPAGLELRRTPITGHSRVVEISVGGLEPEPEDPAMVAIDGDAPMEVAVGALSEVAKTIDPPEVLRLLFAVPDLTPRPPVPAEHGEAFALLEQAVLRAAEKDVKSTIAAGTGRCNPWDWAEAHADLTCAQAAETFAKFASRGTCREGVPALLVWWTEGRGALDRGIPVTWVPIWTQGQDVLTGEGTWAEHAAELAAKPQLAMTYAEGVVAYHRADARLVKRVLPIYPKEAKPLNLGDQRCLAKVWVDAKGVPAQSLVTHCPKVFRLPTQQTLMQWRWAPTVVDGEAVPVIVDIAIIYKLM